MRAVGRFVASLRAFDAQFRWLIGLLLRSARRHTIAAFLLSLLATATHVAAIGIFLSFVHAQTTGGVLTAGPLELPATTALASLTLWSAAVLLMAIVTATAAYRSATLTIEAGRRAARAFLHEALAVLTDSQVAHNELLSSPQGRALARQTFFGDSVVLIRSAVVGASLFAPLLLFLVAVGALLLLDASLTAGIALPLALFLVPFWRHNREVVAAARDYKRFVPRRSEGLKDVFDYLSKTHADKRQAHAMLDVALDKPVTTGFERAIGQIMLRGHRVNYLKLLFLGVALCGLLFAWGAFQSSGSASWSALVTYVVSLQYAVATMGSLAASITNVTRFVPYLERMRTLTTTRPAPPPSGRPHRDPVVRVAEPRLPGSAAERRLWPGEVLACAHPVALDAFSVPAFLAKLTGSRSEADALAGQLFYCGNPPPAPGPDWPGDAWEAARAGADETTRRRLEAISTAGGGESGEHSPELLSYALLLLPGLVARRRLFVLDWGPLRDLTGESQAAILDLLRERVTILALRGLPGGAPQAADAVAVVDGQRVLGLGDREWYAGLDRQGRLLDRFRAQAEEAAAAPADDLDDTAAFD